MSEINTNYEQPIDQSKALAKKMLKDINNASEREFGLSETQVLAEKRIWKEKTLVQTKVAKAVQNSFGPIERVLHAMHKPKHVELTKWSFNWDKLVNPEESIQAGEIEIKQQATVGSLMWTLWDLGVSSESANDDTIAQEKQLVNA